MASIPKLKHTFGSKDGWSLILKLTFKVIGSEIPRNLDLYDAQKKPGMKKIGEL